MPQGGEYTCPVDHGILDVRYNYDHILHLISRAQLENDSDHSIWRYRSLLPISRGADTSRYLPPLHIGCTPLYTDSLLARKLHLPNLLIKDDTRNPTGSLKDRASALAVVRAQEEDKKVIATASTGNAASSLAGIAASVGLPSVIFVPRTTPAPKLAQIIAYGAHVVCIDGSYDQAYELCEEACHRYGWYNRNTSRNPYLSEGKKTVSYEICEQMHWEVPDKVFVPVGDGCVIGAVWKGFKDFHTMGFIAKLPQIIGVQPEGSNALCRAFHGHCARADTIQPRTIADSLSVALPKDDVKALAAVRESNGTFVEVSDAKIQEAQLLLAKTTGVFAEPAGSTPLAGLQCLLDAGAVAANEKVLLLVTGSGLKDTGAFTERIKGLPVISPDIASFEKTFGSSVY
ncbi:MAG: threonine synthase [Candidatus Peregrinibacteria bacterium]